MAVGSSTLQHIPAMHYRHIPAMQPTHTCIALLCNTYLQCRHIPGSHTCNTGIYMQCNQHKDAKSGWGESDGNGRGGASGTSEGDCGSFLWSPTERRCKLHKTTAQILSPKPITTEATSYKDYIYCVRRKYTAHLFCLGLYRHPPMV